MGASWEYQGTNQAKGGGEIRPEGENTDGGKQKKTHHVKEDKLGGRWMKKGVDRAGKVTRWGPHRKEQDQ